jgi:hypothetical protein
MQDLTKCNTIMILVKQVTISVLKVQDLSPVNTIRICIVDAKPFSSCSVLSENSRGPIAPLTPLDHGALDIGVLTVAAYTGFIYNKPI